MGTWGIWLPGFCQFVAGLYIFIALVWFESLKTPSLFTAALAFGAADVAHGSGFLSVYLVGLAVGSTPSRYRGQLVTFHEGVAYVAQVALFIVLGLLVFPSDLPHVAFAGLGLAGAPTFVAWNTDAEKSV